MIDRFTHFPHDLARRTRRVTLAGVPAIIAHPDWATSAPVMLWMHGRTVSKELDPGRYLRWVRAGIAAVALDLPGHGDRLNADLQQPTRTLDVIARMVGEIDHVVEELASPEFGHLLDHERMGIGGMSAGGMCTLSRLCEGHDFVCAAVECTTGWLEGLYFPKPGPDGRARPPWGVEHDRPRVEALDPSRHLAGFRPIPILFLHSESDQVVPVATLRPFLDALTEHYRASGADPGSIETAFWANTGAPLEHAGFGKFGNEAKNTQVAFLRRAFGIPAENSP